MGDIFDFASIGPNQGLKTNKTFFLFHLCGHVLTPTNIKRTTNCSIFSTVTAFRKLVPKTNHHVRVEVPAEKRYILLVYSNGLLNMKSGLCMVYNVFDFCEFRVLLLCFCDFRFIKCLYFFLYTLHPYLPVACTHILTASQICVFYFLSTHLYFLLIPEHILGLHQFLTVYYN